MNIKEDISGLTKLVSNVHPTLGIDLDGTITDNILFFKLLIDCWAGKTVIVTYRDHYEDTTKYLSDHYIKYDKLILAKDMDKSQIIIDEKIDVYIDDQDEMIQNAPESVTILKIRNGGNFDFNDKKWLYSNQTGKII